MSMLTSSRLALAVSFSAICAQAGLITFEDGRTSGLYDPDDCPTCDETTEVWNEYESSDGIIFGLVDYVTDGNGNCNKVVGGNCQIWYRNWQTQTQDEWARPILAEFGPNVNGDVTGFIGPILEAGTYCDGSGPTPGSPASAAFCSVCCDSADGATSNVDRSMRDVPIPGQGVGDWFLTDGAGLSNPNNIQILAISYGTVGTPQCGGSILDIDCNGNDPNPKEYDLCESWLIRGWTDKASADAYAADPNGELWNGSADWAILSAQPLANLFNDDLGRYKEICDPARLDGADCALLGNGHPDFSDPLCCPTGLRCGIKQEPWCALTSFGPAGVDLDRSPSAGDGLSSVFNLFGGTTTADSIKFVTIEWAGTKIRNIGLAFDNFNTDGVVTEEATYPPGFFGDPHFYGFSGGAYDVMGEPGHIYNVISDSDFQMNARFVAGKTAHNSTYLGEIGLIMAGHQVALEPEDCSAVVDAEVHLNRNYGVHQFDDETSLTMTHSDMTVHTPRYNLVFSCVSKSGSNHFNLRSQYMHIEGDDTPHGILGQSADGSPRYGQGHQGEGAIEGVYSDYEVTGLFDIDFKFNRFGTRASRRLLSAEGESLWLFARADRR